MIAIRPATRLDEEALGSMGAALMRQHHAEDPARFILTPSPEAGYGQFLVSTLADPDYLLLVAERSQEVVGYVLAEVVPRSWEDLRGPCTLIHDIYVQPGARREGAGRSLLQAAIDWAASRGKPQVVLFAKSGNESARRLFASSGPGAGCGLSVEGRRGLRNAPTPCASRPGT